MRYKLQCVKCGAEYDSSYGSQICGACHDILEVVYTQKKRIKLNGSSNFWEYEEFLPDGKYEHVILGGTRLTKSRDRDNLLLKLEIDNPTRSFKDRGSVIEIGKAIEYGYDEIVCASTGNMAYSLSYYAEIHDIPSKVFVIGKVNKDKMRDIREVGNADVTRVKGDFNAAQRSALNYYSKHKNSFLAGDYCYRKEGQKTIAYEIMAAIKGIDYIFVPVGNATLLSGLLKALEQLERDKAIERVPRIVAVQARGSSPFVKAFNSNAAVKYEVPHTVADAIEVGMPTYGNMAIPALRKNGGSAIAVDDKELIREQKFFYEEYGIIAETAAVAGIVAFKKARIPTNKKCVAIVTGGNV
jgi:threonine synthase